MVYKCEICDKEFDKRHSYIGHCKVHSIKIQKPRSDKGFTKSGEIIKKHEVNLDCKFCKINDLKKENYFSLMTEGDIIMEKKNIKLMRQHLMGVDGYKDPPDIKNLEVLKNSEEILQFFKNKLGDKSDIVMEQNELKKRIYKEKPNAVFVNAYKGHLNYHSELEDGTQIPISIPFEDLADAPFDKNIETKFLIRWIQYDSIWFHKNS